jgi:hypothetical protein
LYGIPALLPITLNPPVAVELDLERPGVPLLV